MAMEIAAMALQVVKMTALLPMVLLLCLKQKLEMADLEETLLLHHN